MDARTVRILSLDGGGVRGYLSLTFLKRFVEQWGIDGSELWKYFDVIAGTSIGGIQALGYAYGRSPEYMETFFLEKAGRIFTTRTLWEYETDSKDANTDSNRPNEAQQALLISQKDEFYKSPYSDSNYGHNILQQVLEENFSNNRLTELKTKVVIPAYDNTFKRYVMFSNYFSSMFRGQASKIVDVARATSAAPIFLPAHSFADSKGTVHEYIDGGIYQNNPTEIALSLGRALKPYADRYCVLSLGTGGNEKQFGLEDINDNITNETTSFFEDIWSFWQTINPAIKTISGASNFLSGVMGIKKLFDIASGGGQESIDFNLKLRADSSLEKLYYYRFQPQLDSTQDVALDNSTPEFLEYMRNTANDWFTNDITRINNFIGHLKV